eukprot:5575002-Pyramimonas_sp.AAC.1
MTTATGTPKIPTPPLPSPLQGFVLSRTSEFRSEETRASHETQKGVSKRGRGSDIGASSPSEARRRREGRTALQQK